MPDATQTHVACTHAGSKYVDAGATATDYLGRNITSSLQTYGVGLVDTNQPTDPAAPFIIRYDVTDSLGTSAVAVYRRVVVACATVSIPHMQTLLPFAVMVPALHLEVLSAGSSSKVPHALAVSQQCVCLTAG